MRCDWQPRGTLHVAHSAAAMRRLESRFCQPPELGARLYRESAMTALQLLDRRDGAR